MQVHPPRLRNCAHQGDLPSIPGVHESLALRKMPPYLIMPAMQLRSDLLGRYVQKEDRRSWQV